MSAKSPLKRCWIVCSRLGVTSEVWLYRQIRMLRGFAPEVVCWAHVNPDEFPSSGFPLRLIDADPTPRAGWVRWINRFRNLPNGNYYGSVGLEARTLRRGMTDYRPEVILAQFGTTALRILPVARRAGVPVVAHFHGADISSSLNNRWYLTSLAGHISKFAAIIVVADYQRENLVKIGADRSKIHVIPCGIPLNDMPAVKDRALQPCRFLGVGRMVEKKAPLQVIRAFASCGAQVEHSLLTLIGDGPLLASARKLAEELGLADRIRFAGELPPRRVLEAMADSSVFVQHSVVAANGDMEGWPVALAEAMAVGLPVVATRHAGIVEQVTEGETGHLVDENDWRTMGDRMAVLAANPLLREKMGRRAAEDANRRFDQAEMVDRLEAVLESVTETRSLAHRS